MMNEFNCDPMLGTKERCPHCGQFHLRPGYCQTVHKQSVHAPPVNTDSVNIVHEVVHADDDARKLHHSG